MTCFFRPIRAHLTLFWNVDTTLELRVGGQSKREDKVGRSLLGVQNVEANRNQPVDELIVASVKRDDSIDHAPAIWQFLFEKGHQEYLSIHLYVEPWYMYTNNKFKLFQNDRNQLYIRKFITDCRYQICTCAHVQGSRGTSLSSGHAAT
jgi:hypothetical protein